MDTALDNLSSTYQQQFFVPRGQIYQTQTTNFLGQAVPALMDRPHRSAAAWRMSLSARGAGMSLPDAIRGLEASRGWITSHSCLRRAAMPMAAASASKSTRGNAGMAGSSEFEAVSRAWQRSGTIPAARQMLTQELSLMG